MREFNYSLCISYIQVRAGVVREVKELPEPVLGKVDTTLKGKKKTPTHNAVLIGA